MDERKVGAHLTLGEVHFWKPNRFSFSRQPILKECYLARVASSYEN